MLDAWYFPALYDLLISENGLDDFLPTEHLMDETAAPQEPAFREDLAAMIWSIYPGSACHQPAHRDPRYAPGRLYRHAL